MDSTKTARRSTMKSRWTKSCVQHISRPRTRSRMFSTVKVGSDFSCTMPKDIEVIYKEVKRSTRINRHLEENQSDFSVVSFIIFGNTSSERFGKETPRTHKKGNRVIRCATLSTPAKTVICRQNSRKNESTNISTRRKCHCRV